VELCFVLCTLLGGRRKIDLAAKLSELGVVDVLSSMFVRLAWGTNKSEDENRAEQGGIHGPGCECNPESALRVQFLRLLHNFCDRDCDNSFAKRAMLTKEETLTLGLVDGRRQAMLGGKPAGVVEAMSNMERHPDCPRGLLAKVVEVLIAEPADSKYKFWLASCIESYLRGATPVEQAYVREQSERKFTSVDSNPRERQQTMRARPLRLRDLLLLYAPPHPPPPPSSPQLRGVAPGAAGPPG
jgi:Trpc4-associated protein